MKASDVAATLEVLVRAGKPAHLIGSPGVGKTSVWEQTGAKLKMDLLYTRLAEVETIDFRGMPVVDQKSGTTRWLTPDEFPKQGCKPTIWFMDEWSQGLPSVQAVAGRLLNERRLGNYVLPDNVYIGAASNRAKDRAATNKMPSHIADRFYWIEMQVDVADWCKWAFAKGIETEVVAFIRWRDELLSQFDPSKDVSPTPRSWEDLSVVLASMKKNKQQLPDAVLEQMIAGKVGAGAAVEFTGFLKVFRNLPDPTAMLMNPDKCELPTEPATLCAVCTGLAKKATDANMDRVIRIANRLQDEFSVLMVTLITGRDAKLASTRAFIQWAERYQAVLS